ncbi:MAG TPA: PGPGW domain-containing protein [Anaeromyxobacter sp.]|nr:PGPGW domain-containing protein [Anaeromyxobacter sp.]
MKDANQAGAAQASRARRVATLAAGYALLAGGTALLVLPGPGVPLLLGGLAIVGREHGWARDLHRRIRDRAARLVRRAPPRRAGR